MACNNSHFLVNQLNTESLDPSNFVFSNGAGSTIDQFGNTMSRGCIYVKANLDNNIHFIDSALTMPCALINSPSAIELNQSSYAYETDPTRTVIAAVAAEDFAISILSRNNGSRGFAELDIEMGRLTNTERALMRYVSPIIIGEFGGTATMNDSKSDLFTPIAPKAAHPFFAGVPFKSNTYVYGPWINYPSIDGEDDSPAGVEVKVMDDFAPWNFGGMVNLDFAANEEVYSSIQYDQILEMGSVTVAGLPDYSLGGNYGGDYTFADTQASETISNTTYDIMKFTSTPPAGDLGPVITNMSVNINSSNIGTTYNFRTYARKVGFFNKEAQDAVRQDAKRFLGLQKRAAVSSNTAQSSSLKNSQLYEKSLRQKDERAIKGSEANLFKSKFFATSPGVALVGFARPFLAEREAESGAPDKGASAISSYEDAQKKYRMRTFVGLYPANEIPANVAHNYKNMSVMSLDGIFSPVSFYPTLGSSTYAMRPYPRKDCPHCGGDGSLGDYPIKRSAASSGSNVTLQCPYCYDNYPSSSKSSKTAQSSNSNTGEVLPPYVLTNNNDIANLDTLTADSSASASTIGSTNNSKSGVGIPVNIETLNPVVVPEGLITNSNEGTDAVEKSRHCIEVVANNVVFSSKMSTSAGLNRKQRENKNPDYSNYSAAQNAMGINNQRFFGFRGPMVLHGWGYDIDGYPVPNASDEPRYDTNGRPLRFAASISVENSSINYDQLKPGDPFVGANETASFDDGYRIKIPNDSSQESSFAGQNVKKLKVENDLTSAGSYDAGGDIITQQYTWSGSEWSKGDRSTKFMVNYAEQPDRWPVGPIDLRWDYNRKVWTVPSSNPTIYKWVYVTLEEDLIRDGDSDLTYAARGYIDDIEYVAESLDAGYRRLVYVKDRSGYTAPRGTKLLCKYMPNTGFYEPISKPVIVTTGTITGGQGTLSQSYARGNSGAAPTLTVSYANPLGFDTTTGGNGVFTFIDGSWTLTAKS